MNGLVLSLFLGLLDRAFEEEGFCVVRGPDLLWGGDIRAFHPPVGRFDGVIGGPPCQSFSRLRYFVQHNGFQTAPNLIPEFERCVVAAQPSWFVMENVPEAPWPNVGGYSVCEQMIKDVWVGGDTSRRRRFVFGAFPGFPFPVLSFMQEQWLALHRPDPEQTVTASGGTPPGWKPTERHKATRKGKAATGYKTTAYLEKAIRLQGLPAGFLSDAPFTVAAKIHAIGNGVPLAMGRAVARSVRAAIHGRAQPTPASKEDGRG